MRAFPKRGLGKARHEASRRALDGFTMRDSLTEELARSLIAMEAGEKSRYVENVGMTIVMRMLTALRNRSNDTGSKVKPLPRWRLKRIQAYVADNIGESISLPELPSSRACRACTSPPSFARRRATVRTNTCSFVGSNGRRRCCCGKRRLLSKSR